MSGNRHLWAGFTLAVIVIVLLVAIYVMGPGGTSK
jgi:hypothetical protein